MFTFTSCSSEKKTACACVEEFNTMRINSQLYQKCIDVVIANGATDDPYNYFKNKCNK